MKQKKTKKYEVVFEFVSTTWETISIDAVDGNNPAILENH